MATATCWSLCVSTPTTTWSPRLSLSLTTVITSRMARYDQASGQDCDGIVRAKLL